MAQQTFTLLATSYLGQVGIQFPGVTKGWRFNGIAVDNGLSSTNDNNLAQVYIDRFGDGAIATPPFEYNTYFVFNENLSAAFEANGTFTLAIGSTSVEINAEAGSAGAYTIDSASLAAAFNAMSETAGATAGTLTINDNAGTDTTPPTISGTPSTNPAGTVITIGFNENLDSASEPAASAFTTSPTKTITDISISGSDLLLTVSPPFVNDDTITVSYTTPSANPLQDATGNDVASFSGQSVTNNVPAGPAALSAAITGPASVRVGDTPTFNVAVTGGTGTISRQWQYRYRGTGAWTDGGTGTSYQLPEIPATQANQQLQVRCNVDRGTDNAVSNVISRQVAQADTPTPPPTTGGDWPPSGTLQIQPAGFNNPVNFASHEDAAEDVDMTGEWHVDEAGNLGAVVSAIETLETKVENIEDLDGNTVLSTLARWTVKTQIGDIVGGVGLLNDGTAVRFYIAADRFAIVPPGSENIDNARLPFVVSDGQVFINSAVIANASIGALKAEDAFLTNLTAAHGTLATARIEKANIFDLAVGNSIQSDDYSAVGANIVAVAARRTIEGITFIHDTAGTSGNGYDIAIQSNRGSANGISVTATTSKLTIILTDTATTGFVNFSRADIVTAVNNSSAPVTASGTGVLAVDFSFGEEPDILCCSTNGNVYRWNNSTWLVEIARSDLPPGVSHFHDVIVDPDNGDYLFVTTQNDNIYRYDFTNFTVEVSSSPADVTFWRGVAIASNGDIVACSLQSHDIDRWDGSAWTSIVGQSAVTGLEGLAVDNEGNYLVVAGSPDRIYTVSGSALVPTLTTGFPDATTEFKSGIAVDPENGDVYISDNRPTGSIWKHDGTSWETVISNTIPGGNRNGIAIVR